MKKLSETNPYLQDKEKAMISNTRSVRTSCGVEGIIVNSNFKHSIKIDTSRSDAIIARMKSRLSQ
ncbi:MAG: hypothetical protein PSV35_02335, partial [bacterium]|nr:hypothetical protein [bacterium]